MKTRSEAVNRRRRMIRRRRQVIRAASEWRRSLKRRFGELLFVDDVAGRTLIAAIDALEDE